MPTKKETTEKMEETKVAPKTTKKMVTGNTKKMVQKRSSSLVAKNGTEKKVSKKIEKEEKDDLAKKLETEKPKKEKSSTKKETKTKKEPEIKDEIKKQENKKSEKEETKSEKKETKTNKKKSNNEETNSSKNIELEEPIVEKVSKKKAKVSVEQEEDENKEEVITEETEKKDKRLSKKIIEEKVEEDKFNNLKKNDKVVKNKNATGKKKETEITIKEMAEIQAVVAKEMKQNKRLPEVEFQKISTRIFHNIALAVFVMCYLNFVILGFINIENSVFITDLKVFSVVILAIAIGIIEYAYKKESGKNAIHGIEMLILSIITMGLIYLNIMAADKFIVVTVLITYTFSIYYIVKALLIFLKMRKRYFIENMREIIRK